MFVCTRRIAMQAQGLDEHVDLSAAARSDNVPFDERNGLRQRGAATGQSCGGTDALAIAFLCICWN